MDMEQHFDDLDSLRASGVTNRMGAGAYLHDAFQELESNPGRTREIPLAWMRDTVRRRSADARSSQGAADDAPLEA